MKVLFLFLISLFATHGVFSQTLAQAQWRGVNRDGIYNETGLLKKWPESGPQMLWHFDELGKGYSSPIVFDGKIYITGSVNDKGFLFALDINGKLLWKTEFGDEWSDSYQGTRTTPTLVDGKLYVHSSYGVAACINATDGKIIWSRDLQKDFKAVIPKWGIAESPLVYKGMVYFSAGGEESNIVALDKESGKTIWASKAKSDKSAYCSPEIINHKGINLLITMTADNIVALNPEDGNIIWTFEKKNKWSVHPNTPTYYNGMLYCVSGYGSGGVMLKLSDDAKSVTEVWKNTSLDNQMGGVILLNGFIYGSGHNDVTWQCLEWTTGEQRYKTKEIAKGTVISAEGLLYAYSEKGEVALLKPGETAFEIISKFKVELGIEQHWAHLVISNGVLYVRHGNVLMAYNIKDIKK